MDKFLKMLDFPYYRRLFLLSFLFLSMTFLTDSRIFSFVVGPLSIRSETHPLYFIVSGIAFFQGVFVWFLDVKRNRHFSDLSGYIHFFTSLISVLGLELLAKRKPDSLIMTRAEAKSVFIFDGALLLICLLYFFGFILFATVSLTLLIEKREE